MLDRLTIERMDRAAHGGAIVVTSRPGMTRFAILLPLLHEPAGQPQASPV